MSKLSDEIIPLINYNFTAKWYPETTISQEKLIFEYLQNVQPYSDFTSSLYSNSITCETVVKNPLYNTPMSLNFSNQYIEWLMMQKGAKRSDVRIKSHNLKRVLLFQFKLELPLISKFLNPDYWFNNRVIIPTHYVDADTEKTMCFKFNSSILTDYTISIDTENINKINCTIFGFNPEIIFVDKVPTDFSSFDSWLTKDIEIYTEPINLPLDKVLFSIQITNSGNLSFNSYKEPLQLKDIRYVYIPKFNGTFQRLNGYINMSEYAAGFETYDWILVQNQPQFGVSIELFDPSFNLPDKGITKMLIKFKNNNDVLGQIPIYITDMSSDVFRLSLNGFGNYIPGDFE